MARLHVQWSGTSRTLDGPRVVIGRELDSDVPVTDARASRHHAYVQVEGERWVLIDASSNGTFVAGQPITRLPLTGEPVTLHLGGPTGEQVVISVVPASNPAPSSSRPVPQSRPVASRPTPPPPGSPGAPPRAPAGSPTPPVGTPLPQPEQVSGEFWKNLPPPQLPAQGGPSDAWRPAGVLPPGQLPHGHSVVLPQQLQAGRTLTIGREHTNDIVLDDALVSRQHARLDPPTTTMLAVLHDLNSF
ncbi:MAG: FHA domain-containing protein, partial [Nocardioidaceae bacterium]|nr:FHA domain-containing protein [Nocardioidaceae bacterium]